MIIYCFKLILICRTVTLLGLLVQGKELGCISSEMIGGDAIHSLPHFLKSSFLGEFKCKLKIMNITVILYKM